MYAIVEIAGQQFKVEEGQVHFVHRLEANEGDKVSFDQVLLLGDGDNITVGTPTVNANVSATVLEHVKGKKVIVFKKKRRKGYKKKNGHRQSFTKIQIDGIGEGKGEQKVASRQAMAAAAPVAPKAASGTDNLTKIEGIGPKIAGLFNDAGINTFAELAATDVEKMKEILAAAGKRYAIHNPSTWGQQAQMAADGKWDELKVWQDELDGGVAK
jgi:large subunit ribosomal protein L21